MKSTLVDGSVIDFDGDVSALEIDHILLALAYERRFANQIKWTVLQHSLACGMVAESLYRDNIDLVKKAYTHDLQEAFVRDVPTPVKEAVGPKWKKMEEHIQKRIFERFNLPLNIGKDEEKLHEIDKAMCYVEASHFFSLDVQDRFKPTNPESLATITEASKMFIRVLNRPLWSKQGDLHPTIYAKFAEIISTETN